MRDARTKSYRSNCDTGASSLAPSTTRSCNVRSRCSFTGNLVHRWVSAAPRHVHSLLDRIDTPLEHPATQVALICSGPSAVATRSPRADECGLPRAVVTSRGVV